MKLTTTLLIALWFSVGFETRGQTIVADTFNVAGNGTGFALNTGVNSGINPPTTRLTGTARANLRYIHFGNKTTDAYAITGNQIEVAAITNSGRFVLSADGTSSFDFGSVLGISAVSATNAVVYDLSIRMNNNSAGTQRFSFGLATAQGDVTIWDFGVQLYRTNSANSFYTIGKRIDTASSGLASDVNAHIISLTPNTFGNDITILMRVTDAGAETTTFNSRVQLSLNGGNSWFYDTATDPDLPNGWRLDGSGRHIIWDVAGSAGPVTYDAFSLKLNPPLSNANTSAVLRAMAYNIHWAAGPDGKVNTQRISDFIISKNVDIVGFNEVARFWDQRANGRDIIGEIAEQTGMNFVFANNKTDLSGNAQFGNAILSKYPIMFKDHRLLPRVGDNEQRGWHKAIINAEGKFLSFWTTHLDFKSDDTERLMCGTNFNTWLSDEAFPVIFVGDFNDTPNTPIYNLMDNKWIDIWPIAGDGTLGRTVPCPGPPFNARIDYIWKAKTSTSLRPANAFVGYGIEASDHYPVLTEFVITNFFNRAPAFYFPFDQGSGSRVTDMVGGLTAIFGSGGPVWSNDSPTSQSGDYSLYFDGTKKITITDTNQIIGTNGLNDSYTLQAWVKIPMNYSPSQPVVLFQYNRHPGFSLCINSNRTLLTSALGIREFSSTAAIPNDGQWHHIAVVHNDGTNMRFYIDASGAGTTTYRRGAGFGENLIITIGADSEGGRHFSGYLDRVSFENRAIPPMQFDFPATPSLGIRTNGNSIIFFWPATRAGYALEANGVLQTNGWTNVPFQTQDGENQATILPTNSARYFRLKR